MKLLFITQKADRNDPVLGFMHAWFLSLSRRIDHLHLLVLEPGDGDLPDNVTVHSMGKERGAGRLVKTLNFFKVLVSLVLGRRVDAVFAHMCPIYAVLAWPLCRLRGIPLLMWITHGDNNATLRRAHKRVDAVLTASPESCALRGPKLHATGHGIDTTLFSPDPSRTDVPVRIVSVGRISRVKDYATLLEGVRILVRDRGIPGISVSIVGACYSQDDEKYKSELVAFIAKHNLAGIVRFEGAVMHDTMPRQYNNAHVFVSTSLTGSVDKAVLEAMACECVTVTCNPSFNRVFGEFAKDLVFPERNAPVLADRLESILKSSAQDRSRMAADLRRIVCRDHDLDTLMARIVHEIKKQIYIRKSGSPRTRWIVSQVRGDRILDIGFAGAEFPFLHYFIKDANPESHVIGFDLDFEKMARCPDTTAVMGNALVLPFRDNSMDCVVFAEIYEHLLEPVIALRELERVLKPGGTLVFSTPSAYDPVRWVRRWFMQRKPWVRKNYRAYLVDEGHIQFADPLSLFNIMDVIGLRVQDATTKKHRIPVLSRFWRKAAVFNIPWYPFTRVGSALCITATKKASKPNA